MNQAGGAVLMLIDVAPEAVAEHDDWHSHEHLPERLGVPGFVRGTRWARAGFDPRYCVMYEVRDLAVLSGADYRSRLDNPTPWTTKMMAQYRGMSRTLCQVAGGEGAGIGSACLVLGLEPAPGRAAELRQRLLDELLPGLAGRRGLLAWRLLENALPAPMTREQAMRGRDRVLHSALWITGYDADALAALAAGDLAATRLAACGAAAVEPHQFTLACTLSADPARAADEEETA